MCIVLFQIHPSSKSRGIVSAISIKSLDKIPLIKHHFSPQGEALNKKPQSETIVKIVENPEIVEEILNDLTRSGYKIKVVAMRKLMAPRMRFDTFFENENTLRLFASAANCSLYLVLSYMISSHISLNGNHSSRHSCDSRVKNTTRPPFSLFGSGRWNLGGALLREEVVASG